MVLRIGPEKGPYLNETVEEIVPETFEGYFNLSSDDKNQKPVRLSVFDCDRTRVEQAKAILDRVQASAVTLNVSDVRSIDEEGLDRLDVVDDPLPSTHPKVTMEGADGHCAILGLDQGTKTDRRRLRFALVDISSRAE